MGQNSQQALALLGGVVACPQCRVESSLVPRDHALDLPAMPVNSLGETALHETSVSTLGPATPGIPAVDGDGRGANAQLLSAQDVVALAVIGGVGQQAGQADIPNGLAHGRGELRMVIAGPPDHHGTSDQVGLRMTDDRQLRPATTAESPVSTAFDEVGADVMGLQAGRVDGPLALGGDQAALGNSLEDDRQQAMESPFFINRPSA